MDAEGNGWCVAAYNLKFDDFAVNLHSPDFLWGRQRQMR